jgi:hypothetical protein
MTLEAWATKRAKGLQKGNLNKNALANEIVPYQMTKALDEIDRLRSVIIYRCSRDDIRQIQAMIRGCYREKNTGMRLLPLR